MRPYMIAVGSALAGVALATSVAQAEPKWVKPEELAARVSNYTGAKATPINGGIQYTISGLPIVDKEGGPYGIELIRGHTRAKLLSLTYKDVGQKGPSAGDEINYTVKVTVNGKTCVTKYTDKWDDKGNLSGWIHMDTATGNTQYLFTDRHKLDRTIVGILLKVEEEAAKLLK